MTKRADQKNFVADSDFDDKVDVIRASRTPIPSFSKLMRALVDEEYERVIQRKRTARNHMRSEH